MKRQKETCGNEEAERERERERETCGWKGRDRERDGWKMKRQTGALFNTYAMRRQG